MSVTGVMLAYEHQLVESATHGNRGGAALLHGVAKTAQHAFGMIASRRRLGY